MAGTAAFAATMLTEGSAGTVEFASPAARAVKELYLRPGGPHAAFVFDLGVDARDIAPADDLILVAAGDDGLLVLRPDGLGKPLAVLRLDEAAQTVIRDERGGAWVSGPSGVTSIDLADPSAPRVIGRYRTAGEPLGLAVQGGRGYVLTRGRMDVLDVADPARPVLLQRRDLAFDARAFAIAGASLYLAAGEDGVVVQDLEAPGRERGRFRSGAPVLDVAVAGDRVYLAQGAQGLTVLARGEDAGLTWLGSLHGAGTVNGLRVLGGRALARTAAGRLLLVDVEHPQAMEVLTVLWREACCEAWDHAAGGAVALARGRLIGFELPADPPRASNEGLAFGQGVNFGGQRRVFLDGDFAYVADWFSGLHVYDVSQPARPVLRSSYFTGGSPKGVVVRDGVAWVADDDRGLLVLDVRDPARPRELARLPLPGLAYTPVLEGDRLYVAVHRGGVVVVDASDPANPRLLLHQETAGKAWSMRVRDGIAWVADDDAGLLILDLRDLARPATIGGFQPGGQMEEVLIDGDLAYVALYDDGVRIVDISDPAAPAQLSRIPTPGNARGLALRGSLLYVADWLAGMQVIDVADPRRPRRLAMLDTDGAAWGVALHGDTAFVADWWGGISILAIGDPGRPAVLGTYPRRHAVEQVAVEGRFAWVAQGDGGLQVFDIGNPLNPTWVTGIDLPSVRAVALGSEVAWALADAGQRLARIDASNPFQARLLDDIALPWPARGLRPVADGGVLVFGSRDYALIDAAGATRARATLEETIVDAASAGDATLLVTAGGRVLSLDGRGDTATVATLDAPVTRLTLSPRRAVVHVADEGFRILSEGPHPEGVMRLEEAARIRWSGPLDAIGLDGDRLYAAAGGALRIIDIATPQEWRLVAGYDMMDQIDGITVDEGILYLAGAPLLRALEPLPEVLAPAGADRVRLEVPFGLPPGGYDVADARPQDAAPENASGSALRLRNVLRIEPLRFGALPLTRADGQ